jgi:hypothetical protein
MDLEKITTNIKKADIEDFRYYEIDHTLNKYVPKLKIGFPFFRKYPSGRYGYEFTQNETDREKYLEYAAQLKKDIDAGNIYVFYPWNLKADNHTNQPTVKIDESLMKAS